MFVLKRAFYRLFYRSSKFHATPLPQTLQIDIVIELLVLFNKLLWVHQLVFFSGLIDWL